MNDAYVLSYEGGDGPTIRACAVINDPHMALAGIVVRGSWAGGSEEALKSLVRALVVGVEAKLSGMLEPLREQLEEVRYERVQFKRRCDELEAELAALRQAPESTPSRISETDSLPAVAADGSTPCPTCRQTGGFHDRKVHGAHEVPAHLTWGLTDQPLWARRDEAPPLGAVGQVMLADVAAEEGAGAAL